MLKRRDLPLYAFRSFEATARLHSMKAAAEELGVTYSAISHQIRKLEEALDVLLFDRRQKPFELTPKGRLLLADVTESFDRLTRAAQSALADVECELTISCVPGLATCWLIPNLGDFLKPYANLSIRIVTEFWHNPAHREDVDFAIYYGSAQHSGKRVVRLGQSEFFPVCSPRIAESLSDPARLLSSVLLHDHSEETWSRWLLAASFPDAKCSRNIFFDTAHLALEAARSGYGVAMGDRPTVQRDLEDGRLVRLFDQSIPAIHPYYIATPPLDQLGLASKALEDWLVTAFEQSKSFQ